LFFGLIALGFGGDFARNSIENPRVLGSIPRPATKKDACKSPAFALGFCFFSDVLSDLLFFFGSASICKGE
jgi:hypothetical protein